MIKLESFQSGNWQQRYQYKSFEPTLINQGWYWETQEINSLLESATRALGELNAFSLIVPDIDLFVQMHVVNEAHKSSKIEGTQTTLDEALLPTNQISPERRDDQIEVRNYVRAVNQAIAELEKLPLSNRLLRDTHKTLMQGARGESKLPGQFRTSQNWIGGSSIKDAIFIPPYHENVVDLMSDLEKFWHNEQLIVPHLIKAAITHYQFETIHPFLDGNGRIGRLLIPLYLISNNMLNKPSLYLSDFFERNRSSYYDALMRVRVERDMIHWIKFFLNGIAETSIKGRDVFRQILSLRQDVEQSVLDMGKRVTLATKALQMLYANPIVSARNLEQHLSITAPTANALINALVDRDILTEITGQQRGRIFAFDRYLGLFLG